MGLQKGSPVLDCVDLNMLQYSHTASVCLVSPPAVVIGCTVDIEGMKTNTVCMSGIHMHCVSTVLEVKLLSITVISELFLIVLSR